MPTPSHFSQFLSQFNPTTLAPDLPFFPYDTADLDAYISNDSQFQFSLKKAKGQHILYGPIHAQLRQSFFNKLPKDTRLSLIQRKLDCHQITPLLQDFLHSSHITLFDVRDIGMAHSVYCLTYSIDSNMQDVILKQEALPAQEFWTHILATLGWPTYRSKHYVNVHGQWEITEKISDTSLAQLLLQDPAKQTRWIKSLAQHAALGDVLGRGDRHLDNYMLRGHDLLPIDVSYIFWPDNDHWVEKYIAGGIYEVNMAAQNLDLFWKSYEKTLDFLTQKSSLFDTEIATRFHTTPDYLDQRKELYAQGLEKCTQRQVAKKALQALVQKNPDTLQNPYFKMYYLADLNSHSAFYLVEDQPVDVIGQILT